MRQKTIITKLLQSVTEVYYKMCQVLQSATVITKWDITKCESMKLQSNFIEIALWHGCSPVNLLYTFSILGSE